MRRKQIIIAALAGAALVLVPAAATSTPWHQASDAARERVAIRDNFFDPRSVSIEEDDKVTWSWRGENTHNVTFTKVPRGASKRSAETRDEGRWARSFRKRGLYKYICTIHAGQRGSINVEKQSDVSRSPATGPGADGRR
jgi:plastocyanin